MVDSVQIWPPGLRLTDTLGAVLPGGQVRFFEAGTTTPKEMFSDKDLSISLGSIIYTRSDGLPVVSEGSTTTVTVYTDTDDYKFDVLDADDATVVPVKDNVRGALDTSIFLTADDTSTFTLPVVARTTDLTVTTTHRGKLINCNATGGNFTLTLDNAATLGDGWSVFLANANASGAVFVSASQAITIAGTTVTRFVLLPGEQLDITCDGTAFKAFAHSAPFMKSRGPSVIQIADRVSSAPVGPSPGDRYIVAGAFDTYAVGDIIEYNGSSYTTYTPATDCGWIAYVQDEDIYYFFRGSAWVAETATSTQQGTVKISTQALMEAAAATDTAVVIAHQHYHPGHPKAWLYATMPAGVPTISQSYNITGVTDTGTGNMGVTIATDFSSAAWCGIAGADNSDASLETGEGGNCWLATKAAGSVQVCCDDVDEDNGVSDLADPTAWNFAAWGDQA